MRFFFEKNKIAALTLSTILFTFNIIEGCTGIQLRAQDGSFVHGRTLEFGVQIDTNIIVVPRRYSFTGTTPEGKGLTYQSKYAAVGAIAFDRLSIMDGMNEKGLAVGAFYFQGFAEYPTIDSSNSSKALSPVEFSNWIVTQFATVDEVRNALNSVVIAPTVVAEWGAQPVPLHYIVYDKSGKSLVIEPLKGQLVSYDNPIGVLTNSPTFDWHLTNLRNFVNLTPFNTNPITINGYKLTPLGQGSGMVGLPGDFTPPSRFVRAAIFTVTATPSKNANEAIFQTFHILNQFDIPVGTTKEKVDGVIHSDYTQVTCARDPQSLKYYFKTYDNQSINFVDLTAFDLNDKTIKKANTSGEQNATDFSSALKPIVAS